MGRASDPSCPVDQSSVTVVHRVAYSTLIARMCHHLVCQPGLPDPGLAREQEHTAAPVTRVGESTQNGPQLRATAHEDAGRARRLRFARSLELGVVGQDRALELLELWARLEPEFFDEGRARIAVDVQSVRLTSRAVQREHQLTAQALAQRLTRGECLQLRHELCRLPCPQVGLDPILDRRNTQLLQPRHLRLRERLVHEVRQGGPRHSASASRSSLRAVARSPELSACLPSAASRSKRRRSNCSSSTCRT